MPEQQKPNIKLLPGHHSDFPISVSVDWLSLIVGIAGVIALFLVFRWLRRRRG